MKASKVRPDAVSVKTALWRLASSLRAVGLGFSVGLLAFSTVAAQPPSRDSLTPFERSFKAGTVNSNLQARPTAPLVPSTGPLPDARGSDLRTAPAPPNLAETNAATPLPARNMDSLDEKQKLGVGDKITFRVLEDQEEPKSLTITDAGELDVPELGLVSAAGKTCKQLAFEIKPRLEQTTYYKATVIIGIDLLNKTMSGRKVYVVGQVRLTGPQEIPAGESWTVSKAVMRAGGFTDFADKKRVRLVRAGPQGTESKTFILNVSEIWEKGRTEKDLSVEPEDLIYVPTRAINIY